MAKKTKKDLKKKLLLATYNIRTMRLDDHLKGLEQELQKIKWNILGICETCLKGETTEKATEYNIPLHLAFIDYLHR